MSKLIDNPSSGGGGGVTGSSDNSLTIVGSDGIINVAHANTWTAAQLVEYTGTDLTVLGSTYHYTGTTGTQPLSSILYIDTADGNDTLNVSGLYSSVIDTHGTSGVIEDSNDQRSAFSINYTRSSDSSVEWIDGSEILKGNDIYVFRSGAFTGLSHPLNIIGYDITVSNDVSYNNVSGNFVQNVYGSKILVQSNGTLFNGTLTKNVYGQYIQLSTNNSGTSNAYGIYISSFSSADNNYPIYSSSTGTSYFAGDIQVPDEAYGSGWNGSIEVPTKNAIYDKIESLGGITLGQSIAINNVVLV